MHWIDPACLPETKGRVTLFLLNPHGELDGLILNGHRQVHVPPHLGPRIARHVAQGDRIRVRGIKPRDADMIAAVQVTTRDGREIIDEGPEHGTHNAPPAKVKPTEIDGEIALPLYGPKGELRGALLTDGTSLRMPPLAAAALTDYLRPVTHVRVWGAAVSTRYGTTIDVSDIAELIDAEAT